MCQGLTNQAQVELALRQLQTVATLLEQSVQGWQGQVSDTAGDLRTAADLARSLSEALGRAALAQGGGELAPSAGVTVQRVKHR